MLPFYFNKMFLNQYRYIQYNLDDLFIIEDFHMSSVLESMFILTLVPRSTTLII